MSSPQTRVRVSNTIHHTHGQAAVRVDFDGRLLAEASPGPGERIVVAPVDISALRHERAARRGHHMLAHLRTEAYPLYQRHQYPPKHESDEGLSYERNNVLIDEAKKLIP